MKRKHALIATGIVTAVGLLGCVVLIGLIATRSGSKLRADGVAANAGAATGVVMAVGYGAIWGTYYATADKRQREEARARKRRKKRDRDAD